MKISGNINLPGDKSISHRALMFASLTDGECIIHNISTGEDVETTRKCLWQCGILSQKLGNKVQITGGAFSTPELPLDCGNSGTSIRLLAGLLSGKGITVKFIGDTSLSKRPMNKRPLKGFMNFCSLSGVKKLNTIFSGEIFSLGRSKRTCRTLDEAKDILF